MPEMAPGQIGGEVWKYPNMPNGYRTKITKLNCPSDASIAQPKKRARGIGFDDGFQSLFHKDDPVKIS